MEKSEAIKKLEWEILNCEEMIEEAMADGNNDLTFQIKVERSEYKEELKSLTV